MDSKFFIFLIILNSYNFLNCLSLQISPIVYSNLNKLVSKFYTLQTDEFNERIIRLKLAYHTLPIRIKVHISSQAIFSYSPFGTISTALQEFEKCSICEIIVKTATFEFNREGEFFTLLLFFLIN